MKYGKMIIDIINALEEFEVKEFEVFENTIYLDFDTQQQAEYIYYHLIFNHEDLFEDISYDTSRNNTKIRVILKYN